MIARLDCERAARSIFQQIFLNDSEFGGREADYLAHETFDTAVLVDEFEDRIELRGCERNLGEDQVAFEKVGDDSIAIDPEHRQQHRGADAGAVAAGGTMEEQGVNVALGEQFEEAAPVAPKVHHERQMIAAGLSGDFRVALVVEPFVAHRDMFPSHAAARSGLRRTQVLHFGAALESDEGAELEPADGTFRWDFGEMRRAEYPAGADATAIGGGMATEVAEILRGVGAQQIEVDDHARLFGLFSFLDASAGRFCIFRQEIDPSVRVFPGQV